MKRTGCPGLLLLILPVCLFTGCKKDPEIINQKPTAIITASVTSGEIPLSVEFDAGLSSDPEEGDLSSSWTISDGSKYSTSHFTKTFTQAGTYNVQLTVTDEGGLQDSDQTTISVNEPPSDLFPIAENAQWVYHVKATETENGSVSGYEEGYVYIILKEIDPDYSNIDVAEFRVTGKKYYNGTSLVPGDYIHMIHSAGKYIELYHSPGSSSYARYLDVDASSWSNYAMFFSQASSQSASRSYVNMSIGLGSYDAYRIQHQRDNWGENYVTERYDISETEYLNEEIGLIYRKTTRYVNFLDCFTCPVYGGNTEFELVGYSIPQDGGTMLEGGTGYNTDNPYGGDLGLITIWAIEDIGFTEVKLDGTYVGTIMNYWPEGIGCDQPGALNVTFPAGTYTLTAESTKGYTWEGDITFTQGGCDDVQLLLSKKSLGFPGKIPLTGSAGH